MLKKILSLILLGAFAISSLTSCGRIDKKMAKAEEHFRSNPYTVNISVDFVTSEEIESLFNELEKNTTTVRIFGGNYTSVNEITIGIGEDVYHFTTSFTSVNGTLYKNMSYTENRIPRGEMKNWAPIDGEKSAALLRQICLIGGVSAEGFSTSAGTKTDKKTVSVCYTDASDEVKAVLDQMMIYLSEDALYTMSAKEVSLTVTLKDKKYSSAIVVCKYGFTLDGEEHEVVATVKLDFFCGEEFGIYHPEDSKDYERSELDTLLTAQ